MLAINKILRGRYRIIQQLGNGEAGTVYKAHDNVRDTNVALKEISVDWDRVSTVAERELLKHAFADQAKLLAKVKHESLPQIRGFFSEVDRQYLVMELVDGDDAGELLAKTKTPLALSDVANWADQLLDALDYLHTFSPPVVHCNIKPQNVKLTSRGRIKLLDFGIAKSTEAKINTIAANQTPATALPYSPIEQILQLVDSSAQENIRKNYADKTEAVLKQTADAQSDVYALGATLYHLLTAQLPINALERAMSVWAGKPDPLPSAHQVNSSVSMEVSDFLMKAMEVERENRFASAIAMRQALQAAVETAKKREAEEAKKKEEATARETLLAEEKKLEQERQKVEEERLQLEAEQKKQKEAVARQLKEAEAQRLEAEKRAAEAEKRLLEKESKNADGDLAKKSVGVAATKQNSAPNKTKELFAEPVKENNMGRMIPIAAVIFLMLGGAAWGIWAWQKSNPVEANQSVSTQTDSAVKKSEPEPTAATTPAPIVTPETTAMTETTASEPSVTEAPTSRTAPKNKSAVPPPIAPRIEKQTPPQTATKATPKPKKAVTVDDLIGGN
jgi:serine/threonine protein kinase